MKTKITNLIYIIFGLIIITFLIYNRVLLKRLPRDIFPEITFNITIFYVLFFIISFTFLILNSYYLLHKLIFKRELRPNKYLIKFIAYKWNPLNLISRSLVSLDTFIKNQTPRYNELFSYADYYTLKLGQLLCKYKKYTVLSFVSIKVFSEIILCILFLTDIIIFKQFKYFYNNLWLLLIPMLIAYIIYTINKFLKVNLDSIETVLEIRVVPSEEIPEVIIPDDYKSISIDQWRILSKSEFKDKLIYYNTLKKDFAKELSDDQYSAILKNVVTFVAISAEIFKFLDEYKDLCGKYEDNINIVKYSIYTLGWGYILFSCFIL
jgi:hypothetical protein